MTTEELTPDELLDMVSYQIRLIQIVAYKNFERQTRGFGTAPRYYGLLRIIEANPGVSQSRLAEAVYLDRSSLVPILETLSNEEIVERRPSETDMRVKRVFLTDKGAALISELRKHVHEHEEELVEGLSEDEIKVLSGLLRRIGSNYLAPDKSKKGKA